VGNDNNGDGMMIMMYESRYCLNFVYTLALLYILEDCFRSHRILTKFVIRCMPGYGRQMPEAIRHNLNLVPRLALQTAKMLRLTPLLQPCKVPFVFLTHDAHDMAQWGSRSFPQSLPVRSSRRQSLLRGTSARGV